ncbi:MAG: hypothetical protein V4598_02990 [Bdellovibrionota bacterium]
MNILFLILISSWSIACDKEVSLESIFAKNDGLPMYGHFKTYIGTLLTKAPLREKYCGEKLDSAACFQKLRKLPIEDLIKLQNGIHHEDLLIHENSGQNDIDEFLVKEFSNSEVRRGLEIKDRHRMPLIVLQSDRIDQFLKMTAVLCQEHLRLQKNDLLLNKLLVNSTEDLVNFLKIKPLPVFDAFKSPFESMAMALETPDRGAMFFSACLENLEKSCELNPDSQLCELKRTIRVAAWKYSEVTHQINYFETSRDDGHRLYPSTGEKLLNRLVLQTPQFVMNYGACQSR